jgi:16S rRNA G966 N2-methylase RsmD
MRIIAGTKRGMNLFSPPGRDSRPIIDRVKQALFNVLQKYDLPAANAAIILFFVILALSIISCLF